MGANVERSSELQTSEERSSTNLVSNSSKDSYPTEVKIFLNDKSLQGSLEIFKDICEYHEKNRRRSCKKRFYELGLVARIAHDTTDEDFCTLLKNGVLTFMFDSVSIPPPKLSELVDRTVTAIERYQNEQPRRNIVAGLAFEIKGDCCRLGRCRNDCSIMLCRGDVITLTTDEAYHWSGYKEVCYAINLKYYMKDIKMHDVFKIGNEAEGRVVKKLNVNIAVFIDVPGLINSFEYIDLPNQCKKRPQSEMIEMYLDDLNKVNELGANYIVLPKIRCKSFLETLRNHIARDFSALKLIGSIDFEYVGARRLDLWGMIKCLDYLWIYNFFRSSCLMRAHICECVVPKAKSLNKPIIGAAPLQCCNQFNYFANELFLWKIDSIFLEKSGCCCKYPIIVRKLLPLRSERRPGKSKKVVIKNLKNTYQSRINFILRSISNVNCRAIFLYMRCEDVDETIKGIETSCPIYIMMPLNSPTSNENELKCMLNLARAINLRRNAYAILYTNEMNEYELTPLDYGIDYAIKKGCIDAGDFIITAEAARDNSTEDVLILQAFYLPKQQMGKN